MAVYLQKGSKNYWISIYRDGKRSYIPTGSPDKEKAEATEALLKAAIRGNLERERFITAVDSIMEWNAVAGEPLSSLWDLYLQTRPEVKAHTLNLRKGMVKRFTSWAADAWPSIKYLHEISPQMAYAFADWVWNDMGGKGKTQNNRIGEIKAVMGAVVVRAGMDQNPFGFVKKVDQSDSVTGRAFSKAEQRAILKRCRAAGNDWFEISTIALYSGLRLVDLAGLRWIDLADGFIRVKPSKTKKHGVVVRIPMHSKVVATLDSLERKNEFVFPHLNKRYKDGKHASGYMPEVLNKVDLDRSDARISFHCWRHTFRTNLAAAGVPLDVAMQLGGWTDEKTAAIYNHDYSGAERAIAALV